MYTVHSTCIHSEIATVLTVILLLRLTLYRKYYVILKFTYT